MRYIQYVDLPPVPEYLIEPITSIIAKPPKAFSHVPSNNPFFKTRLVSDELFNFLQSIFDFKIHAQYQLVYDKIPIHRDLGQRIVAYNYLLDTGGDNVRTAIYDDSQTMIEELAIEPRRWCRLTTGKLHGVHGIDHQRVRVAISVCPQR